MRRYLLVLDRDLVILVTGRSSSWLARLLRLDPVHRLTVFPLGAVAPAGSTRVLMLSSCRRRA